MDNKAIRAAKLTAAGILDKARARTAVTRAGGQIAPSKYLPNVPRQVHADGGRVDDDRAAFLAGNHPDVPEVLYHGNFPKIATKGWTDEVDEEQTQKNRDAQDFRTFKPSEYGNFGPGIYLSDSPKVASNFAQGIRGEQTEALPHGQVFKLHVSMKNPFTDSVLRHPAWKDYIKGEIDKAMDWRNGTRWESDVPAAEALLKKLNDGTATVRDIFLHDTPHGTMVSQFGQGKIHQTIRNSGFDGIIAHRPDGSKEYVAFHPTQVKSATGNQGTFDPNDPDITKAGGGEVDDEDGITAYHSSPHDFDQFDISKLGTGEGNQSYGPGLYFAENPKVSDRGGQYWNQFMNRGKQTPEKQAAFALKVAGWDRDKAADSLQKNFEYHADRAIPGKYGEGPELEEGNRLLAQETQEAIDHVRSGKILGPRTYKVKLNVKPHELIDWDEPLSEQHPNIQAVLGSSHETAGSKLSRVNRNPKYRGDILGKDTATLQELYDHFRSKGIKGIRYNDAGSRHGPSGDGTKNYVMFHHDPVQVVDKYEYGGTVGKEEGGATGSLREKGLWPSAQAIKAGTGSREAHEELVNKIKPVSPYLAPVAPASDQQVHDALTKDKQPKAFAPRALGEGTPVAVRLDIPAYEKKNTWVVSVHHPKTDFTAGEVIGYDSVAHIGNPRFGVHPTGALNIASGKPKATIATVHGNWKKTTPEDAFKLSQTVHNDPQWRQVGMDPERHSYFYDRETQEPVMAADEALHIGPLVYAKNPVYGKKTDFAFSEGGEVDNDQPNNVVNLGFRRTMRNAMSDEPPQHVQDVFNHLGDRFEASRQAYVAAKSDGVFDHLPFGDRYKYKLTPNSTPMEVVGHRMMPVERWGMKEPPKLVYQGHYPVVDMEPVGNPADTRHMPVELLADKDRYEFVSGKPRLVKRKGGAVAGALALTRRFTKDGTGATMALKPKGK